MSSQWKKIPENKEIEELLLRKGCHQLTSKLCSQIPYINENNVDDFIDVQYRNLSNAFMLHDMDKAIDICMTAVTEHKEIAIIGDYDCDGIISTTMLMKVLRVLGANPFLFLPSRLKHGYGLNSTTIEAFKSETKSPSYLLFVVDCGMNSFDEIEQLKQYGIEKIIVIDHHLGNEEKLSRNADALITWHLSNNFNEMCAAGEVYHFIRALATKTNRINPVELLSLAAIATIADVSPIIGDNRILVKKGLTKKAIDNCSSIGLHLLLEANKIYNNCITQEDIAFKIAPNINAAGRMDSPDIVHKLLMENDIGVCKHLIEVIQAYNQTRKDIQKEIEESAIKALEGKKEINGIFLVDEKWHVGVVGIVASKLVEKYNVPAVVVGSLNGVFKGSGRTCGNINIKELVSKCDYMLEAYGGHEAAIGLTLKPEYKDKAFDIFNEVCSVNVSNNKSENVRSFSSYLNPKHITPDIRNRLHDDIYPYCQSNNPCPYFCIRDAIIVGLRIVDGKGWKLIKFKVAKNDYQIPYEFYSFSVDCDSSIDGKKADIYFSFPIKDGFRNEFQLHVEGIVVKR